MRWAITDIRAEVFFASLRFSSERYGLEYWNTGILLALQRRFYVVMRRLVWPTGTKSTCSLQRLHLITQRQS